jgi:fibrillarin-like pre-rRNA processing protein
MVIMVKVRNSKFEETFLVNNKLATVNLVRGKKVYGEELIKVDKTEYRIWDFWHSKPSAAIKNGLKKFPLKKSMKVLYLGAASGTTISHFSDIVGNEGIIYGVEISERVLRELIPIAKTRGNIIPILADARKPEDYEKIILEKVDLIYSDVASPDQVDIIIRNSQKFLKLSGYAIIAIKSQSIDAVIPPKQVYRECIEKLENYFEILDKVELDPYEKFHLFLVMRLR